MAGRRRVHLRAVGRRLPTTCADEAEPSRSTPSGSIADGRGEPILHGASGAVWLGPRAPLPPLGGGGATPPAAYPWAFGPAAVRARAAAARREGCGCKSVPGLGMDGGCARGGVNGVRTQGWRPKSCLGTYRETCIHVRCRWRLDSSLVQHPATQPSSLSTQRIQPLGAWVEAGSSRRAPGWVMHMDTGSSLGEAGWQGAGTGRNASYLMLFLQSGAPCWWRVREVPEAPGTPGKDNLCAASSASRRSPSSSTSHTLLESSRTSRRLANRRSRTWRSCWRPGSGGGPLQSHPRRQRRQRWWRRQPQQWLRQQPCRPQQQRPSLRAPVCRWTLETWARSGCTCARSGRPRPSSTRPRWRRSGRAGPTPTASSPAS